MKYSNFRLYIKPLFIPGVACMVFPLEGLAQEAKKEAPAIFIEQSIVVDGEIDTAWEGVAWSPIEQIASWDADAEPITARFKAAFDENALFILVDVTDSFVDVFTGGPQAWQDDSVELFVDVGNEDGPHDENSLHVYFRAIDDGEFYYGHHPDYDEFTIEDDVIPRAMQLTEKGYQLEVEIPWSVWQFDVFSREDIGFDIYVNNSSRWVVLPYRIMWSGSAIIDHQTTDDFGILNLQHRHYGPYRIVRANGQDWVESDELGWLWLEEAPWLYSPELQTWIHAPENQFNPAGAWVFVLSK